VLAKPESGQDGLKDFTVTRYNGKYIVYGTVAVNGGWNGFFSTFDSFDHWATATPHDHEGHVAPTLFYFEPKDVWVLAYQWGLQYKTTKTPDVWESWSSANPLISGDSTDIDGNPLDPKENGNPIDPTVICDDKDCYIFFADDAGGVYRGSMPIGDFPGTFTGMTRIMKEPTSVIFEGIQVYAIKGSNKYLMIIENSATRRFLAWTATSLGGTWTPLSGADSTESPFAGQANVTWPDGKWTEDISHGDLVRENPSQKMEIDPCHLQFLYQGHDPNPSNTMYEYLPYRPGLLTLNK
jgi:hypothetical protein